MDQGGKITLNHKWKSCRHGNRLRVREILNIKQKEIGINVKLVCCMCLRRPIANFDLVACETACIICYQVQLVVKSHVVFLWYTYAGTCFVWSHTWHAIHVSHSWFGRISLQVKGTKIYPNYVGQWARIGYTGSRFLFFNFFFTPVVCYQLRVIMTAE
jgi:hypothetical protein